MPVFIMGGKPQLVDLIDIVLQKAIRSSDTPQEVLPEVNVY